jgi:hypothetical protein
MMPAPPAVFLRKTILLPFLLVTTLAFGQSDTASRHVTDVWRVAFFNPGVSFEKAIGPSQTLFGQVFLNTLMAIRSTGSPGKSFEMRFDPAVLLQYRYYYNYKRRQQDGKRTVLNSLNYVAPVAQVSWLRNSGMPLTEVGAVWGFQRNYPKRFSLDLNMGVGCGWERVLNWSGSGYETKGKLRFMGQLSLGFWLNRR